MIRAEDFVGAAGQFGFDFFVGVPCSYLTPLINHVSTATGIDYIAAANEGEAVAMAIGASLAGRRGLVMFQNSGLGNALNPIVSLCATFRVAVLLICTWRGAPDEESDEPQHALMGEMTLRQLELMRISWDFFPTESGEIVPALERATRSMAETDRCYALVMRKGSVSNSTPAYCPITSASPRATIDAAPCGTRPGRREVLSAFQQVCANAALVATTGYIGRALYQLGDSERQLYVVGGMGCASSVGLGLALSCRQRQVIVLDGDGAALMRLGALATLGQRHPPNLVHVILDNEMYESTGGQASASSTTDLAEVAAACGYPHVMRAGSARVAAKVAAAARELTFIHIKVRPEPENTLPRPTVAPHVAVRRFRHWFADATLP